MLNEPRGGVFHHINLLVPAKDKRAVIGWIIMEPEDTPPTSGSNSICVSTVLLDTGIVPMTDPEIRMVLEAPGGLIEIVAQCSDGKAQSITVRNAPSFASKLDATIEVEGIGTLTVDIAYSGDSFVIADAEALGFAIVEKEARDIAEMGIRITRAANEQLGFSYPTNPDWAHISFYQIAGPLETVDGTLTSANAVVIQSGKIDRSSTGTGCLARMAALQARGLMGVSDQYLASSIIGSKFHCRIEALADLAGTPAIIPSITGRSWIAGTRQEMLAPTDP